MVVWLSGVGGYVGRTNMRHITCIVAFGVALMVAGCVTRPLPQAVAPTESAVYVIQRGDTLRKIAMQHHLNIKQLKDLNPDLGLYIKVGQEIYVLPHPWAAESGTYVIQRGDTLKWIAEQHHLTVAQLKDLNPDLALPLKAGQKVYVLAQVSK